MVRRFLDFQAQAIADGNLLERDDWPRDKLLVCLQSFENIPFGKRWSGH